MLVNLRFLLQFPKRVYKFQISIIGCVVKNLPDLMRYRIYKSGKLVFQSHNKELPMRNNIVELDTEIDEWFIAKEDKRYDQNK